MSFLPGGGSNLGNHQQQATPTSYYDMTPEQQAQAGAEGMIKFMTSCPGKTAFAGVTGFALGGVFGLFMASVSFLFTEEFSFRFFSFFFLDQEKED